MTVDEFNSEEDGIEEAAYKPPLPDDLQVGITRVGGGSGSPGGRVVASNPMHEDDEDDGADVEVQKPGGEPVSATPADAEEATAPTNDDDEEKYE